MACAPARGLGLGLERTRSMRAPLNILAPTLPCEDRGEAVLDGCVRASYTTSRDPLLHWGVAAPPRIFLFVKKWDEPSSLAVCLALGRWLTGLGRVVAAGADGEDGAPLPRPEFARLGLQADGSVLSQADVDMVIVVGGDGSVMHASALFGEACPPVLALSTGGSLGFLTAHTLASARELLCRVMHLPPEACEAARAEVAAAVAAAEEAGEGGGGAGSSSSGGPASGSAGPTRAGSPLGTERTTASSSTSEALTMGSSALEPSSALPPLQRQPLLPRLRGASSGASGSGGGSGGAGARQLGGGGGSAREEEDLLPPLPLRAPGCAGVSMRMRLQVEVYSCSAAAASGAGAGAGASSPSQPTSVHVVLNELHLGRGASPIMTRINAFVDDEPLTTVLSDGLIISTQTGSTAYALSAGGSILSPSTRGIMFCPICPHTLSFRPLVLSDAAIIRLEFDESSRGTCQATFDGRPDSIPLCKGDFVVVRASPWPLPLLVHRGPTTDWLLGLHQKLLWNVRGDGSKRIPARRTVRVEGAGAGGEAEGGSGGGAGSSL